MFNSKACITGLCLLCVAGTIHSQDCHIPLRGRVTEAETKEPLAYASVYITEAQKGTTTDESGYFAIPNLCENTSYTVEVSHVECADFTQVVRLRKTPKWISN